MAKENYRNLVFLLAVLLITAFAGYLRFVAVSETKISSPIRADAAKYYTYAHNLRVHGVYSQREINRNGGEAPRPDALISPGYPLFVAMFLKADDIGLTLNRVLVAQAAMSTLVVTIFALLLRSVVPPVFALLGGLLIAINPHLINSNVYLLTESLFTFQLSLFFLSVMLCISSRKTIWFAIAGLTLSMAAITRPSVQYFVIALPFFFFYFSLGRVALKKLAVFLLVFSVIPLSWSARNIVQVSDGSDTTLMANFIYHGSFPGFMYANQPESFGFPYRFDPENDQLSGNLSLVLGRVKQNFTESPREYLYWYLVGKPVFLYSWDIIAGAGDIFIYPPKSSPYFSREIFSGTHQLSKSVHLPLLSLAFISVLLIYLPSVKATLRENQFRMVVFLSVFMLYFTGLHMVGAPFPRYGIPIRPVIVSLSMAGCFLIAQSLFSRRLNNE